MEPIVAPLANINPLLGVIAAIAVTIVGYLVFELRAGRQNHIDELRTLQTRLEGVRDREMQMLNNVVGVLHSVESNLTRGATGRENDVLFQAATKTSLREIHEADARIEAQIEYIRNRIDGDTTKR